MNRKAASVLRKFFLTLFFLLAITVGIWVVISVPPSVISPWIWLLCKIGLMVLFLLAAALVTLLIYKSLGGKRTIPGLTGKKMDKLPLEIESLISNIQGGVVICLDDAEFTITYCSAGFYTLTGYTPREFENELENKFTRRGREFCAR